MNGLAAMVHAYGGGGHTGPVFWVLLILMLGVGVPLSLWRLRRGGPGPQMKWIPRSWRGKANEQYRKHGWREPFDDDGNRTSDHTPL